MTPFVAGFADELTKVARIGDLQLALHRAQISAAQKLLGVDPRVPVPIADSQLDDAVSKLRMQQRLVEMNRRMMGMEDDGEEKMGAAGYVTPRAVRRAIVNQGYNDRDPGFQAIARQMTGTGDINQMTQYQMRTLMSLMAGRPM